jgi:hypothetical protein
MFGRKGGFSREYGTFTAANNSHIQKYSRHYSQNDLGLIIGLRPKAYCRREKSSAMHRMTFGIIAQA